LENWRAFHLFYHAGWEPAVHKLVRPVVSSLWHARRIDSFFFIRYALGGPHIRLRLHVSPGCVAAVEEEVRTAASSFFAKWPSTEPRDEQTIREINRTILANDPHEQEDAVYPDNYLMVAPFRPEVERYGGSELLPHSLDYFAVSSVKALRYCTRHAAATRARRLASAFRILARQLWSFAADTEEAFAVLTAFITSRKLTPILPHGDRAYEERRDDFLSLLTAELKALSAPEEGRDLDDTASRRLSWEARQAAADTRCRIGTSQLHMTANRLGVTNAEEVYLGRILERATSDLRETEPVWWRSVLATLSQGRDTTERRLDELRKQILADYFLREEAPTPVENLTLTSSIPLFPPS
jgi:Lantibiotic biosynthesis dehydratase C-term